MLCTYNTILGQYVYTSLYLCDMTSRLFASNMFSQSPWLSSSKLTSHSKVATFLKVNCGLSTRFLEPELYAELC